jgi:hypothetical protein
MAAAAAAAAGASAVATRGISFNKRAMVLQFHSMDAKSLLPVEVGRN